jgi:hypothetical protein
VHKRWPFLFNRRNGGFERKAPGSQITPTAEFGQVAQRRSPAGVVIAQRLLLSNPAPPTAPWSSKSSAKGGLFYLTAGTADLSVKRQVHKSCPLWPPPSNHYHNQIPQTHKITDIHKQNYFARTLSDLYYASLYKRKN